MRRLLFASMLSAAVACGGHSPRSQTPALLHTVLFEPRIAGCEMSEEFSNWKDEKRKIEIK